jgi:glycosyltransferase involved in cell wall biosynthesis
VKKTMRLPVLLMISSMRGGGSERQTLLLLNHLDRDRFVPHLYLTERAGDLLADVPQDVVIHSFQDAASRSGIYYPGRVLAQQVQHLRDLCQRESIAAIYDRTFHMTLIAGPAAGPLGIGRVSTIVSPPDLALPLVEQRFVGIKRRRLSRAYRDSRSVIAVSRQAADSAQQFYGLADDSVRVIANPVDQAMVGEAANGAAPRRDDRLTIVCVGRMTEEKGHRDLLSAIELAESGLAQDFPPATFWLIGDGPLKAELEAQWKRVRCRHRVEFLGMVPNAAPAIAAADALVLPSHFEGMPNVVLEAMALGTPVIATRAGGTVELERDEPTIVWGQPSDPGSLAAAIVQFATDREAAERRVAAARRLIAEHHDVAATTRVIEDLLARSAARP